MSKPYNFYGFTSKPLHEMSEPERAYLELEVRQALSKLPSHIRKNASAMELFAREVQKSLPRETESSGDSDIVKRLFGNQR